MKYDIISVQDLYHWWYRDSYLGFIVFGILFLFFSFQSVQFVRGRKVFSLFELGTLKENRSTIYMLFFGSIIPFYPAFISIALPFLVVYVMPPVLFLLALIFARFRLVDYIIDSRIKNQNKPQK